MFNTSNSLAVIGSAGDNFKAIGGADHTYDGTRAWVPGIAATFKSLPAGYTWTYVFVANSRGVNFNHLTEGEGGGGAGGEHEG